MSDYYELKKNLDAASPSQWDQIVEDFVQNHTTKEEELGGSVLGFAVSDVAVHDGFVDADVYYLMLGDCKYDENGPYQDEDGDFYDREEKEYHFIFTISPGGIKWESE